jgi:hypothetical protein
MYRCGQSLQGIMYIAFFVCFDAVETEFKLKITV